MQMMVPSPSARDRGLRRIAANLTHPHILLLHDSREADGFLYYVMKALTEGPGSLADS
jgi:hypothetical protein